MSVPVSYYVTLGAILFSLGLIGVLIRKNAIVILMSIELMLNAANLTFVAFSRYLADIGGQVDVFFVLVVAAAEVVVGLAIVVSIYRQKIRTGVDELSEMKG